MGERRASTAVGSGRRSWFDHLFSPSLLSLRLTATRTSAGALFQRYSGSKDGQSLARGADAAADLSLSQPFPLSLLRSLSPAHYLASLIIVADHDDQAGKPATGQR